MNRTWSWKKILVAKMSPFFNLLFMNFNEKDVMTFKKIEKFKQFFLKMHFAYASVFMP